MRTRTPRGSGIEADLVAGERVSRPVFFGVTSLTDLAVRVVADLDTDTFNVFWQLGDGVGHCSEGIPMSAPGLEFDAVRVVATTKTSLWAATDVMEIDYLTVSKFNASAPDLDLTITNGPNAGQVTLIWPTSTPAGTILESSPTLQDPWTEITDPPTVVGDNNELIVPTSASSPSFFRLHTP